MDITPNHGPGQKFIEAAETTVTVMHENQTVTKVGGSIIKIRIPRQIRQGEPMNDMHTQDTTVEQNDGKPGKILRHPVQIM